MGRLLRTRVGPAPFIAIPNAFDGEVFQRSSSVPRTELVYQGGGSPWQGIGRLAEIWAEIHQLAPMSKFHVVSEDERTRVLAEHLPANAIRFSAAESPRGVAAALASGRLGFLVREPNLVNEVSWPMKFGEYLACGLEVCCSRAGWELEEVVEQTGAGLIVDWNDSSTRIAEQIVRHLETSPSYEERVAHAAQQISSHRWLETLANRLRQVTP
jgi:hypothetical protein